MDTADGVVADGAAGAGASAVTTAALLLMLLLLAAVYRRCDRGPAARYRRSATAGPLIQPPPPPDGPTAYPVIGALHAMDGHQDRPFRRFTQLARQYGPVYTMVMGRTPCVIVNDYPSIKEVLITNGPKFGGRPDFIRYNVLFAGDRNNCEYI